MLGSVSIMAFVPTKDRKSVRPFYEGILGLRFVSEDSFATVFDANGIILRVVQVPELVPARFTILGWQVSDVEKLVLALREKGVNFERYDGIEQDDLGIWRSPSGARIAWFKDPDGNVLSLASAH